MSASYCFALHDRCIAPRVRDSIFAEHQRPQVAAFMECVDFMQPRWPSRISTFNSIFCRSFRFGTRESVGGYRTRFWLPKMLVEAYLAPDSGTGLRPYNQLNHTRLNDQAQPRSSLLAADKRSSLPPTLGRLSAMRKAHRAVARGAFVAVHQRAGS